MDTIILFRGQNGKVGAITEENSDNINTFPHRDDAIRFVDENKFLRAVLVQLVELEEL